MAKPLEHVVVQQTAPCAISNSCVMPGPRVAVPHSNLKVCPMHARTLELPSGASGAGELAGTRTDYRHSTEGSREHWATYASIGFATMKFGGYRKG